MALNINTGSIRDAAASVSGVKSELEQLLSNCNETVQSLKGSWEGQAADATTSAFNAFYQKYNTEYEEIPSNQSGTALMLCHFGDVNYCLLSQKKDFRG